MYNKRLFTSNEAAKYLGVNMSTLKKWEDLGKIVSIKKPGSPTKFFPQEHLDRMKWKIDRLIPTSRSSIW